MSSLRRVPRLERVVAPALILGGALAVLAVGLYLGLRPFSSRGFGPWVEILPTTFAVCETRSLGDHFILPAFALPTSRGPIAGVRCDFATLS